MTSRPWDLLNPTLGRVSSESESKRLSICNECEKFIHLTSQCKDCGCFMNLKTKLPNSECPLGKWGQEPKE